MEKANTGGRPGQPKLHTVVLHEGVAASIVSDTFTFAITAGLILLADGRSLAWQIITVAMFVFWVSAKVGIFGKVHKFYSRRDLLEWAQSLPNDKEGDES